MSFASAISGPLQLPASNATVPTKSKAPLIRRNNVQHGDVTSLFEVNPRLLGPLRRIAQLALLSNNWDSYGSPPIRPIALASAIQFLLLTDRENPPSPYIGPVTGGGVQLEWHTSTRELELEILPDGSLEYVMIDDSGQMRDGKLPPFADEVYELICWLMHRTSKYDHF